MRNGSITFQRSLFLSVGIHILIFGSALAFAQYTAGSFRIAFPSITVSLVGGNGGGGAVRKPGPEALPATPARSMQSESQHVIEPAMSRTEAPASAAGDAVSGTGENGVTGSPGDSAATGQSIASGPGDGSAQAGSVFSSEQWKQLQAAIERAKTYPRLAREQGVEGVVLVRFKVAPSGDVEMVDVVKSSGSDILDQASVRTVRRAAPMPYLNGWVEVPMSYVLK
ncbi:MAG: TonB family protein [Nitrospirota bacterium]